MELELYRLNRCFAIECSLSITILIDFNLAESGCAKLRGDVREHLSVLQLSNHVWRNFDASTGSKITDPADIKPMFSKNAFTLSDLSESVRCDCGAVRESA